MQFATSVTVDSIVSLLATTVVIAVALLIEHVATGRLGWPVGWYYAEGLSTVLIGLAIWMAVEQMTVDWFAAFLIVLAGLLAGAPDFILLHVEQRREHDARWQQLAQLNNELAAKLALVEKMHGREGRRARELAETMAFTIGAAKQEIDQLNLFVQQVQPIFGQFMAVAQDQDP